MIDFKAMTSLAVKAMKQPDAVWQDIYEENPPYRTMAERLTIPLVLASAVAGFILSVVFMGSMIPIGYLVQNLVITIITDLVGVFLLAFLANYFAGMFDGERNYDRAFSMVALVTVPSILAGVITPVPLLGWIGGLILAIYGLYLFYRATPVFLAVPENKRLIHIVATIGSAFVIGIAFTALAGGYRHYAMM